MIEVKESAWVLKPVAVISQFCVIWEWTFLTIPATLTHWLGVAHGKWGLGTNVMVDFTAQQLAPLVICVSCSWRSRRHICMTTTVHLLYQANLLHTDLGNSSNMVPVGLSSWGRIRRGRLVPHLWNYCPIFAMDHGATTNFFSTNPFQFFSTSAMPHQAVAGLGGLPGGITQPSFLRVMKPQ